MYPNCPNRNLTAYKKLEAIVGEGPAHVLWNEYNGNVPNKFYAESKETILSKQKKQRKLILYFKFKSNLETYLTSVGLPRLITKQNSSLICSFNSGVL